MGLHCSCGPKRLDVYQILCPSNIKCVSFVLMVHKLQVSKFLTLLRDIFSIIIEFFLTVTCISSYAPSRKHQITVTQVSPELQVLSIEHVSYHHFSAMNFEVVCGILENLWTPAFCELSPQDYEHVGTQTLFLHWAWKCLKLAL